MNYYGYVTSRSFGPMMMPVPAQNSCLREYVSRKSGLYVLPALESNYTDCYHQLFGVLRSIPKNSVLIMYSVLMLPSDRIKRKKVFDLAGQSNTHFAFVLENLETRAVEVIESELANYELKTFSQKIDVFNRNLDVYK